jgi:hypothetical protein
MSYIGSTYTQQLTTPAVDYFNGNGVTTTFQLTRAVTSVNAIQVVVNNVPQNSRDAYGINASNQIVFTSAPSAGTNNIYVVYDSQVGQFVTPSPGTVNTAQLGSISNINSVNSDLTIQLNGVEQLRVSPTRPLAVESPTLAAAGSPAVTIRGESNTERMVIFSSGTGGGTPVFSAFASRGTEATPTASQSGDALGFYQFGSHDGTNFNRSAWLQGIATENHTISNRGTAISFQTTPNGSTSITEGMRLDQNGRVTKPLQPSFHAFGCNVVASSNYLIYPTVNFNIGNHYNATTGVFTAPVQGTYLFGWTQIGGNNGTVYRYYFRVNNANVSAGDLHHRLDTSASGSEYSDNGVYTMPWRLNAGDTARIWYSSDDGSAMYPAAVAATNDYPRFWGHLLG